MDSFRTYMRMPTCDNVPVRRGLYAMDWYILYTCPNPVQSTTQWTASVHTLHMPKPVIQQRSCSKCYAMDDATLSWCLWHLHTWSMLPDVGVLKIWKIYCFCSSFIEKMTVLPQRKANMALGVMGLPHNYAIKNQDFSKSHKYHVSASKAKKFKKKSAYAQGRPPYQPD